MRDPLNKTLLIKVGDDSNMNPCTRQDEHNCNNIGYDDESDYCNYVRLGVYKCLILSWGAPLSKPTALALEIVQNAVNMNFKHFHSFWIIEGIRGMLFLCLLWP